MEKTKTLFENKPGIFKKVVMLFMNTFNY